MSRASLDEFFGDLQSSHSLHSTRANDLHSLVQQLVARQLAQRSSVRASSSLGRNLLSFQGESTLLALMRKQVKKEDDSEEEDDASDASSTASEEGEEGEEDDEDTEAASVPRHAQGGTLSAEEKEYMRLRKRYTESLVQKSTSTRFCTLAQKLRASVFKIQTDERGDDSTVGTAFFVDIGDLAAGLPKDMQFPGDLLYIMTNHHVWSDADVASHSALSLHHFADEDAFVVRMSECPIKIFLCHDPHRCDVVLVGIQPSSRLKDFVDKHRIKGLRLHKVIPSTGDGLLLLHHPHGEAQHTSEVTVAQYKTFRRPNRCVSEKGTENPTFVLLQYQCVTMGGSSGAPVLNHKGQVVAVNSSSGVGNTVEKPGYGVCMAHSMSAWTELWEQRHQPSLIRAAEFMWPKWKATTPPHSTMFAETEYGDAARILMQKQLSRKQPVVVMLSDRSCGACKQDTPLFMKLSNAAPSTAFLILHDRGAYVDETVTAMFELIMDECEGQGIGGRYVPTYAVVHGFTRQNKIQCTVFDRLSRLSQHFNTAGLPKPKSLFPRKPTGSRRPPVAAIRLVEEEEEEEEEEQEQEEEEEEEEQEDPVDNLGHQLTRQARVSVLTRRQVTAMSYRQLQSECKAHSLGGKGKAKELQQKLYAHFGL